MGTFMRQPKDCLKARKACDRSIGSNNGPIWNSACRLLGYLLVPQGVPQLDELDDSLVCCLAGSAILLQCPGFDYAAAMPAEYVVKKRST